MTSKPTTWLLAIVLASGLLTTGCAPLWPHRPKNVGEDVTDAIDTHSFRGNSSTSPHDSIFFNKKSHEIERSLGL